MLHETLLSHFERDIFPSLSKLAPEMAQRFKTDVELLARALQETEETHVCFLGQSNVGKSTLINALATGSMTVIPSGGDGGPLTALATEVRYGERAGFVVEYHSADKLNGIRFALEAQIVRRKAMAEARERAQSAEKQDAGSTEAPASNPKPILESEEGVGDYEKLARLLILGKQSKTAELSYLADCVRLAVGSETVAIVTPQPEDEVRIKRIRAAFESYVRQGKKYERHAAINEFDAAFNADLYEHTAGCLAPLIKRIEVCWPSEILKDGLVLVDLPGTGIASDEYRKATEEYVQNKSRAVLAVVDKSGFTRDTVDMLRDCRYLARLLGSTEDRTADPCQLLIAVTKVDELFEEEWGREVSLPREQRRKRMDVYQSIANRLVNNIKQQASQQLAENLLDRSRNTSIQEDYKSNYEHLISELSVYPVFAPDLRRLLAGDDEDQPKLITDPAQSGIPQLQQVFTRLAKEHREKRHARIGGTIKRLVNANDEYIRQLEARSDSVTEEAVRLRDSLDQFMKPLLEDYSRQKNYFRQFLKETAEERVRTLVAEAKLEAHDELEKFLGYINKIYWSSLKATVRKGGYHETSRGDEIDIADRILLCFQEPMAMIWSTRLLKEIRERTALHAEDTGKLIDQVHQWAMTNTDKRSSGVIIARQREIIQDRVEQMKQLGRDAISEMRDLVKERLLEVIRPVVVRRCKQFTEEEEARDSHRGIGLRMKADFFVQLARRDIIDAIAKPAEKLLLDKFKSVRDEFFNAVNDWGNPLEDAADAIVTKEKVKIAREDERKRQEILEILVRFRANLKQDGESVTTHLTHIH